MGKQSRLEFEAIDKRKELEVQNDYNKATNKYDENHPDARSDGQKPLGKGTGVAMGFTIPGQTTSKHISKSNLVTDKGGGGYDINGRNGVGGRLYLETVNLYNETNAYGIDSVDTSVNVNDYGQFIVK